MAVRLALALFFAAGMFLILGWLIVAESVTAIGGISVRRSNRAPLSARIAARASHADFRNAEPSKNRMERVSRQLRSWMDSQGVRVAAVKLALALFFAAVVVCNVAWLMGTPAAEEVAHDSGASGPTAAPAPHTDSRGTEPPKSKMRCFSGLSEPFFNRGCRDEGGSGE